MKIGVSKSDDHSQEMKPVQKKDMGSDSEHSSHDAGAHERNSKPSLLVIFSTQHLSMLTDHG